MNKIKYIIFMLAFIIFPININANSSIQSKSVDIDLTNNQALQKGAKIFFNYCQGCHGLKYMRYSSLADGIGLKETKDKSIEMLIQDTFMHSIKGINEANAILGSISKESGQKWFGKVPPDLSLIVRYRGSNWLYTYMKSFYKDQSRPWGVNNLLFPDVGMPHILLKLQGLQILKDGMEKTNDPDKLLELIENGDLSKNEYNNMIKDLVTFLSYVGEPTQVERKSLGIKVIIFLVIMMLCLFFLKKEYWKDIK